MAEPVLRMEEITKVFPGVLANDAVSFELNKGEVHALLGENGAGKSTLMNCLYGMYRPDSGTIYLNGSEIEIHNSRDAIRHKIGMVHQHFMLIPELTVTENIILGLPGKSGIFIDQKEAACRISDLASRYGFNIDPEARVGTLPVGTQQRVEILKVLYRDAEILILDEATAVLTPQEADELFKVIRNLTREGKSVLMITHKLEEVMSLSNSVTVLRDGRVAGSVLTRDTDTAELARLMVGRDVLFHYSGKKQSETGRPVLEVRNLTVKDRRGVLKVDNISLSVHEGEILAIAGVDGNGQSELAEAVTGVIPFQAGEILINGERLHAPHPETTYRMGMSHIPQDRQSAGLVPGLPVYKNFILNNHKEAPFSKRGVINYAHVRKHCEELVKKFQIKTAGIDCDVAGLSGGNQQKIILARELFRDPGILVAMQPSRGLDIGATEFVRQQLIDQRNRGCGVLLVSTELEEIMQIADRIAVLFEGRVMGVMDRSEADVFTLGLLMAGKKDEHTEETNEEKNGVPDYC